MKISLDDIEIWQLERYDRVREEAELVTQERNDAVLEQIISRLSLESRVSAISWRNIEQEFR